MSDRHYIALDREDLLADLNPAQREAVTHGGGPLLVVAGAGTGKTRVLTRRVGWLVGGGLPAYAVLAITFTNKAADVLKQRLSALPGGRDVWAGTFHAFTAWLLRRHGERIGVDPGYTVLDREDQRRLLRDLLSDLGPRAAPLRPPEVIAMISHLKNGGAARTPLDLSNPDTAEAFDAIHRRYAERLRAGSLLDFDDLLLEGLRLLREDGESADHYRRRFAHVLVDEYQDTNIVQAELLRALLGPSRNLTVVGDPDQSIYRWRGAAVRNILAFGEDFPGAATVVLERNYRSTARILQAAEHVIEKNRRRHAKRLYTEAAEGTRIREVRCVDAEDEAEVVATILQDWRAQGIPLSGMAVFYRVNALSRAVELALRSRDVPYVVVAGVEFFQRREVKDLLAYARLVENPRDESAFLRIANVPRRGVGNASLKHLRREAVMQGVSCMEVASGRMSGVSARARKGLKALRGLVDDVRELPRSPVGDILEILAERSGYREWLASQEDDLGRGRAENLEELVAYAREFDRSAPEGDLRAFLERTALMSDQDALDEDSGCVSLMSVHAAKGLEFPCVVIAGAEMDYFPHVRSSEDDEGTEEERRLFYVAMTRAREHLALTHAARRFTYRGEDRRLPSPFLRDVPDVLLERKDRAGWQGGLDPARLDGDVRLTGNAGGGEPDVVRETDDALGVGDRVHHPYFGAGRLLDRQGRGAGARVTVDFDEFGRKQLLLSHARLERLS
ncbi:MAG: ATP-dependent helicase [Planctomycetota bacterium]|jgi:DNA helicase-2/ATP-dependent DNA helicase PcrA